MVNRNTIVFLNLKNTGDFNDEGLVCVFKLSFDKTIQMIMLSIKIIVEILMIEIRIIHC